MRGVVIKVEFYRGLQRYTYGSVNIDAGYRRPNGKWHMIAIYMPESIRAFQMSRTVVNNGN